MSLFRRRESVPTLWRADQYAGQRIVAIEATQLDHREGLSAADRRAILNEWVAFLSGTATRIEVLSFASHVPQDLLNSLAGQPQLSTLAVKWGSFQDLTVLSELLDLEDLSLAGATAVTSIEPISRLPKLTSLLLSQAHRVDLPPVVGTLTSLRNLTLGNVSLASGRSVVLPDLMWVRHLRELRHLDLPGTRLVEPDLSPLVELPHLETIGLPLRRAYRRQVFELAESHPAFAELAAKYESYEKFAPSTNNR